MIEQSTQASAGELVLEVVEALESAARASRAGRTALGDERVSAAASAVARLAAVVLRMEREAEDASRMLAVAGGELRREQALRADLVAALEVVAGLLGLDDDVDDYSAVAASVEELVGERDRLRLTIEGYGDHCGRQGEVLARLAGMVDLPDDADARRIVDAVEERLGLIEILVVPQGGA